MQQIQYSAPLHGADLFSGSLLSSQNSNNHSLSSNHKIENSLPFALTLTEGEVHVPATAKPIWQLKDSGKHYTTTVELFKLTDNSLVLSVDCEGKGKFAITGSSIQIDWQAGGTSAAHYFQTLGMALWLEVNSIPCIHANALAIEGKCIALIAPSGMGKSTLSAYMQQQGALWLTDDMLALHKRKSEQAYYVYPSWPKARMWPDSVQEVAQQSAQKMNKVHERFSKVELNLPEIDARRGYKLDAIYVLNRNGADLASLQHNQRLMTRSTENQRGGYLAAATSDLGLVDINSSMALMALLQNSMLGSAYSSLDIEQRRLQQLSGVVNALPIKQIHYKNSYESLIDVHKLIVNDLHGN
jgi:energy-coupling factor transporter ATP-binding protein EcfA2